MNLGSCSLTPLHEHKAHIRLIVIRLILLILIMFQVALEIDYRASGSLAPTRDQWEGPATKNSYSGTISFGIDIFRCGRAFSQRPYSLFQFILKI